MKLLFYCTKGKPYLIGGYHDYYLNNGGKYSVMDARDLILNGKIVGECDYEIEEIYYGYEIDDFWTKTCGSQKDFNHNLLKQSCLEHEEMYEYLQPKDSYYGNCGYAIHIKYLHIFDEPKELSKFYKYNYKNETWSSVNKAPQNMMQVDYINIENNIFLPYILISIRPEWLCKILNGEKTIEVRRKVLKEMVK